MELGFVLGMTGGHWKLLSKDMTPSNWHLRKLYRAEDESGDRKPRAGTGEIAPRRTHETGPRALVQGW